VTSFEGSYLSTGADSVVREFRFRCVRTKGCMKTNLPGGKIAPVWSCEVWFAAEFDQAGKQGYSAEFIEVSRDVVVSAEMSVDLAEFARVGAPDGLIRSFAACADFEVLSSSPSTKTPLIDPERRSDEATKVWRRLVHSGWASHDTADNRFHCPPDCESKA
jgi:hypothetical protein